MSGIENFSILQQENVRENINHLICNFYLNRFIWLKNKVYYKS